MTGGAQEPHQAIPQDYSTSHYPQPFQTQLSFRPPSQTPPPGLAPSQRTQQQHQQVLNPPSQPTPPNYPAYPPSHSHSHPHPHPHPNSHPHPQQFNNFQIPPVAPHQSNFQSHPASQHSITNFSPASHVYAKPGSAPHQLSPNPPTPTMVRPSQHQMAQHLINSQAHMRSQRIIQQRQLLHQQRQDELMITCDPLDYFTPRSSALRRYTNNHIHMNSVVGTHWTLNQLLREDHLRLLSKRKATDPSPTDLNQQRKERLRQKIDEIEREIESSEITHRVQLDRIQLS